MSEKALTAEEISELPVVKVVCLGASTLTKGNLTFGLLAANGEIDTSDGWYSWKLKSKLQLSKAQPGSIWAIPLAAETFYIGRAVYAGQWERDRDELASMWACHRAAQLKWRLETERSKAMNDDRLKAALLPVRMAYRSMNWADRRILLAHVLEYIATGG